MKAHSLYPNISPITLVRCLCSVLIGLSGHIFAREFYFNATALEGENLTQQNVDLSIFSKNNAQLPGVYKSTVVLNQKKIDEAPIAYFNGSDGRLIPQLTKSMLRTWGIKVDANAEIAALSDNQPLTKPLGHFFPSASTIFDFNNMTLNLSIPQVNIDKDARDSIDPSRWDDGVSVMFANYSYSGLQRQEPSHQTSQSHYLNLDSGINLGGWRMRSYSTWNQSGDDRSWQAINTWIQHDINTLKAQFIAGENSTRGQVFDSIQYSGINIASDNQMLPYSQRGFAPVIRGIANSNAEISVRQNGYLIYQSTVAPGAFEIHDIMSTTNNGDLEVTIKEADGTERHFTQPYSSVAIMQRPGRINYELTAGRYRADSSQHDNEPLFIQVSSVYGLNNLVTMYGGVTGSENYLSSNVGAGIALGSFGSLSADVTSARATLDNEKQSTGQSWRLVYSGSIETTDTSYSLASYRYSTRGYYSFADANRKYDSDDEIDWSFQYNKRNRIQANLSQTVLGSSLYLNGYQQDYWDTENKEYGLAVGLSSVVSGISYHLDYSYSKTSNDQNDRVISFGLSIPLSKWLPGGSVIFSTSASKDGYTSQNVDLTGSMLDDHRLSYSLRKGFTNHDGEDNSSIYGSYRSQYANMNAGYYYASDHSQQFSYGISGAIVAHPQGITLAQPLGDEFAIVNANGASGVRFMNQRGVQTDLFGNAIIPSLEAYQENTINVDTTTLPEDVDTNDTALTVVPSRNAAVAAHIDAHVGYRALIMLTRPQGQTVPFGAMATVDLQPQSGIVDDTGMLYLAGIADNTPITVQWGSSANQQCHAIITFSPQKQARSLNGIRNTTALCLSETQQ
ncbi:fimbria/pilus outer membrane usher protein [Atlantibacter sp.]|uniref:fimbria/pilus outer membrane usher protein n=1 Tax=Atlantibacter sp. TaxID=1903473 RepID=UPI0028B037DA|nr:fimbria/pilus outer membrane usher protein [Atlantibacter sp.]